MKQRKSGNGTQLDVEYDTMRKITNYTNTVETRHGVSLPQPEQIAGFSYGYNKEGMRSYENYLPGAGETNQQSRAKVFSYDSLYQVTGVKYDVPDPIAEIQSPNSQAYSKQVTYAFDNSGNRENTTTTPFGQTPVAQAYQANSLNQYTLIDSGIFGYDNVGNMTEGVIYLDDLANPGQKTPVQARFIYDYQNNLVRAEQVSDNRVLGEYVYDALGHRAYKNAWGRESSAYQGTYFWYNGAECIEETNDAGQTIAVYTFGIGIDEAINVEYSQTSDQYPQASTYWYHTDVLGSVVAITNSDGSVIERYKYDIYGEATVLAPDGQTVRAESAIGNRILYTGREYDAETGLYYYRARYYHAQIGKFISVDPMGIDSLGNLFAYCQNNSINYKDPYGLDIEDIDWEGIVDWLQCGDDDDIIFGCDLSVFGEEFVHRGWNVASLNTLNEMESHMQEGGDPSALVNLAYGIAKAVGNVFNTVTLGVYDGICHRKIQGEGFENGIGSGFSGIAGGIKDAGANLLPIDEAVTILDSDTEGWQKTEAGFIAIAKIAGLIALIKGTIDTLTAEPPSVKTPLLPKKTPKPKNTKQYKKPSERHFRTKANDLTKDKNTLIEPGTDVKADIKAINDGNFVRDEEVLQAPSGRRYKTAGKDNTELVPDKGPGFIPVSRSVHQVLKIFSKYGVGYRGQLELSYMRTAGSITDDDIINALKVYDIMKVKPNK